MFFQAELLPEVMLRPGDPALVGFALHQNDVRADAADAAPGNDEFVLPSHQPPDLAGAGDDQRQYAAVRHIDLNIRNKAQPPPIADADNLLAV